MFRALLIVFSIAYATGLYADEAQTAPVSESAMHVKMHKNPGCGCCDLWAEHLVDAGFTVDIIPDAKILEFKKSRGIPQPLHSCHTAIIGDYFLEGHVPARDIMSLLKVKPQDVTGIAVPGMPLGSPGMEHPRPQTFNTIAFLRDGSAYVFARHEAGEDFSEKSAK